MKMEQNTYVIEKQANAIMIAYLGAIFLMTNAENARLVIILKMKDVIENVLIIVKINRLVVLKMVLAMDVK